jgi:hypothetical protein
MLLFVTMTGKRGVAIVAKLNNMRSRLSQVAMVLTEGKAD